VLSAVVVGGASVGASVWGYRYYRGAVERSLQESLQLLPAAVRAATAGGRAP
jgi:hypothetical protein